MPLSTGKTTKSETFYDLALWKQVETKAERSAVANVEKLIKNASALLDRVIETFPTYTLHNSRHAINVAQLMGELLGDEGIEKLSGLEATLLLLSAFYHDLGMVFDPRERTALTKEPEWSDFLQKYPEAFLVVEKSANIPIGIAEWFCRWRHADRVSVYLNASNPDLFMWDAVSFLQDLGTLCKSHNSPAKELHNLETDYLGECDLKFCAILLRLADILDFDGSRAPEIVYRYLQLKKRSTTRDAQSDTEWRKHLASNGFKFLAKRQQRYQLTIAAGPNEPAVEHDLRLFLDVIEDELKECTALLTSCSERWRDFVLPGGIDRRGIKSNGYIFGEYRFTLEQNQILDLLMGENLYDDPYVFIRELLQNALDTSRHREYIERIRGDKTFCAQPITVYEWDDNEGYHWVRFDDFGMGMNEQIIRDFLLKVGRSYYTTSQFKAELLRSQKKGAPDFLPISRFGIGLLSCFLAGERVEILTIRQGEHGNRDIPVRLSLNGLHGFYTLQSPPLPLAAFPGPHGLKDQGKDRDFGTSIAVRLDPRKEQGQLNLAAHLEKHLFCPAVPVLFNETSVGGDPKRLLETPWIEKERVQIHIGEFERELGHKFRGSFNVEFIPLDITKHSPLPQLKGQLILVKHDPSNEWKRLQSVSEQLKLSSKINFGLSDGELALRLEAHAYGGDNSKPEANSTVKKIVKYVGERDYGDMGHPHAWIKLNDLAKEALPDYDRFAGKKPLWLVHNGITMPSRLPDKDFQKHMRVSELDQRIIWFSSLGYDAQEAIFGVIHLSDSLRPNVSVSRNIMHSLPQSAYSAMELAVIRSKSAAGVTSRCDLLNHFIPSEGMLLGQLLDDSLIHDPNGWPCEKILKTPQGFKSLNEVKTMVKAGKKVEINNLPSPADFFERSYRPIGFLDCCVATLVRIGLRIEDGEYDQTGCLKVVIVPGVPEPILDGHKLFPPLTFFQMEDKTTLTARGQFINKNHPFTNWLIEKAPLLHEKYPGIFLSIRNTLLCEPKGVLISNLNRHLDRLRALDAALKPPKVVGKKSKKSDS